jgi:hypothetical protein
MTMRCGVMVKISHLANKVRIVALTDCISDRKISYVTKISKKSIVFVGVSPCKAILLRRHGACPMNFLLRHPAMPA